MIRYNPFERNDKENELLASIKIRVANGDTKDAIDIMKKIKKLKELIENKLRVQVFIKLNLFGDGIEFFIKTERADWYFNRIITNEEMFIFLYKSDSIEYLFQLIIKQIEKTYIRDVLERR